MSSVTKLKLIKASHLPGWHPWSAGELGTEPVLRALAGALAPKFLILSLVLHLL